jgi:hypothetical protein
MRSRCQQEVWFLVRFRYACRDKGLSIGYRSAGMLKIEVVSSFARE